MQVYNFSDNHSIYNTFLSELRDEIVQKDSMRFRRNLERLGEEKKTRLAGQSAKGLMHELVELRKKKPELSKV